MSRVSTSVNAFPTRRPPRFPPITDAPSTAHRSLQQSGQRDTRRAHRARGAESHRRAHGPGHRAPPSTRQINYIEPLIRDLELTGEELEEKTGVIAVAAILTSEQAKGSSTTSGGSATSGGRPAPPSASSSRTSWTRPGSPTRWPQRSWGRSRWTTSRAGRTGPPASRASAPGSVARLKRARVIPEEAADHLRRRGRVERCSPPECNVQLLGCAFTRRAPRLKGPSAPAGAGSL